MSAVLKRLADAFNHSRKMKIATKDFLVPAQDSKGHSARAGFRTTPQMRREISILMSDRDTFGWKTDSDFWRFAGRVALDFCAEQLKNDTISNYSRQVHAVEEIMKEKQQLLEFNEVFAQAEKLIQELAVDGAHDEIRDTLMRLEFQISEMDDDSWRKRWKKKFKEKFGHLVKGIDLKGGEGEN